MVRNGSGRWMLIIILSCVGGLTVAIGWFDEAPGRAGGGEGPLGFAVSGSDARRITSPLVGGGGEAIARISASVDSSESARVDSDIPARSLPGASVMTQEQKLDLLLRAHQRYVESRNQPVPFTVEWEHALASVCVTNILREQGRADYGDPVQIEAQGGFSLNADSPDEWVFVADARYAFPKGEFPAYDAARERLAAVQHEESVAPLDDRQAQELDLLYQSALGALGIPEGSEYTSNGRERN